MYFSQSERLPLTLEEAEQISFQLSCKSEFINSVLKGAQLWLQLVRGKPLCHGATGGSMLCHLCCKGPCTHLAVHHPFSEWVQCTMSFAPYWHFFSTLYCKWDCFLAPARQHGGRNTFPLSGPVRKAWDLELQILVHIFFDVWISINLFSFFHFSLVFRSSITYIGEKRKIRFRYFVPLQ